ncbi:MAG: hypothetical protein OEM28_06405 [Nitrosopumilus sp.]|nr:hypothetical protein [Nitrosopumilus sp.]MDH3487240.1 hypothetical protein [Nitrosopumilus sp.]
MTKGVTTNFGVSLNGIPIILKSMEDMDKIEERVYKEIDEIEQIENTPISKTANFIDPSKDPQHYIDRYYNEAAYKSWFDRNYGLTIEEAVNQDNKINYAVHELIVKEIMPEAEATSLVLDTQTVNNNS